MSNFKDLPTPEKMQSVVTISFTHLNEKTPVVILTAFYINPEKNSGKTYIVHWPSNNFKFSFNRCSNTQNHGEIILLTLRLMEMTTGYGFERTDMSKSKQIWQREDYLKSQVSKEQV